MAHYAFLDSNGFVTEVIVGKNEDEDGGDWERRYGEFRGMVCKQTSYNTVGGAHQAGRVPLRKNFAGIGYFYDATRDAFISPKVFPSWGLNEETCLWEAPVAKPVDGKFYAWDEDKLTWVEAGVM